MQESKEHRFSLLSSASLCAQQDENEIFLTIDIDWASEMVMAYVLDLIEELSIPCSFFVTHKSAHFERISSNKNWEYGWHPNFLRLNNNSLDLTEHVRNVLHSYAEWAPNAKILRPHALVTAGRWLELYRNFGITHLSTHMSYLQPAFHYLEYNGLLQAPICFADNACLLDHDESSESLESTVEQIFSIANPKKVLLFHPIHLALNCEKYSRYELTRSFHDDWPMLISQRFGGFGAESLLRDIVRRSKEP